MQFNHRITAISNSYNEYSEVVEKSRVELRCHVISHRRTSAAEKGESHVFKKTYALRVMMPARAFSTYGQIFTDGMLSFEYDGFKYEPKIISDINDFTGRPKYIQLDMDEVKSGAPV